MDCSNLHKHEGEFVDSHGPTTTGKSDGFALITVLFTLAIVTTLMTFATTNAVNHARQMTVERQIAQTAFEDAELAELAMAWRATADRDVAEMTVEFGDVSKIIHFEDVGAKIDLNTAAPPLLEALFGPGDFDTNAYAKYLEWRRSGRRLQRISDLTRIAGLSPEKLGAYQAFATVYSGRRGISLRHTSDATETFLGSLEISGFDMPDTSPSGVNFDLLVADTVRLGWYFATVSVAEQFRRMH